LGFGLALAALIFFGRNSVNAHPVWFACALIGLVSAYAVAAIRLAMWSNRHFRELRAERAAQEASAPVTPAWEYRSRFALLGLPFIHIRVSNSGERRPPVKAWIAAGDSAIGLLFAFGGIAVAPVSIGGLAIGLLPWGGVALGLFAFGGFALGGWTFGGFALGWQAFGGCALAWNAAMGGLSIAHDFALGGVACAAQANNNLASQFMRTNPFFKDMEILSHHIGWLNLLWLIPLVGWWRVLARKRRGPQG